MLPRIITALTASLIALATAGDCTGCGMGCQQGNPCPSPLTREAWLEIQSLVPGGPAESAGVQPGDVICCYAGGSPQTLVELGALKESVATDSVELVVWRGEQQLRLRLPAGQLGAYLSERRAEVVPDSNAVLVKGVPELSWAANRMSTFVGALEAVLAAVDQKRALAYDDLCGASGVAFRTHFFDDWCPSSAEPGVGYDNTRAALAACGLRGEQIGISPEGKDWPEVQRRVVTSLDAGMPVLAMNLHGYWQWGVITGHQQQGEELFCRTYYDQRAGYDLVERHPYAVVILTRAGAPPSPEEAAARAFDIVVENLTTERYDRYYSGLAAFDHWIRRLETDEFPAMDSARLFEVLEGNYWPFVRLVNDRETAVRVLTAWSNLLPGRKPQFDLLTALYQQEVNLLRPLVEIIPCPTSLTVGQDWPEGVKGRQIAALRKARGLEAEALVTWQDLAQSDD